MRPVITWLLLALVACHAANKTTTTSMTNAPILKVDAAHWMSQRPVGQEADPYRVPACASIILDATGYTFDPAIELRGKPINSIQVVQSKTHQFEVAWQTNKTRYELSSTTLRPLPGSRAFESFETGDKMIIAIGVLEPPRKFSVVWVSMIEVQ
jgi:hypothetical protein